MKKYILVDIRYRILDCFLRNKKVFMSFLICIVVGIVCGIACNCNADIRFIYVSVEKHYAINIQISIGGMIFQRIVTQIFFFCLLFISTFHISLCVINYVVVFLQGYYFGGLIILLCINFGFPGIIAMILVLLPCQLLWNTLCVASGGSCFVCSYENRRFERLYVKNICLFLLKMLAVSAAIILLECILVLFIGNNLLF